MKLFLRNVNKQTARGFSYSFSSRMHQGKSGSYSKYFNNDNGKRLRNMIMIGVLSSYYHKNIIACIEDE